MNKQEERINKIFSLLEQSRNIHLKDLAKQLSVSEMTIRRDLNMSGKSSFQLLGGYVTSADGVNNYPEYFLSEQEGVRVEEKKHIGRLAAGLIENNDTVFFDYGTTIPYIIKSIPDSIQYTALCYSLNVFLLLEKKKNCQIILCGGQFNSNNGIFSSIDGDTPLDFIYPTKAFISAAGISDKGMTCFNLNAAFWKKKVIQNASYRVLVADDSKFGETKSVYFGQISDINLLVTNKINDSYQELFGKHKIDILT